MNPFITKNNLILKPCRTDTPGAASPNSVAAHKLLPLKKKQTASDDIVTMQFGCRTEFFLLALVATPATHRASSDTDLVFCRAWAVFCKMEIVRCLLGVVGDKTCSCF